MAKKEKLEDTILEVDIDDETEGFRFSYPVTLEHEGKQLYFKLAIPPAYLRGDGKLFVVRYKRITHQEASVLKWGYHDLRLLRKGSVVN